MAQHGSTASIALMLGLLAFTATGPAGAQEIVLVSPALPTTQDRVTVFFSEPATCTLGGTTVIQGNTIFVRPNFTISDCPPLLPPDPGHVDRLTFGPLARGSYTIVLQKMGQTLDSRAIFVGEPATQLSLLKGRYTVTVVWSFPDGRFPGTGQAVQTSDASGYFWFFDKTDAELTVKLVNGFAVNTQLWLFVASLTDLPFTLTIVDSWQCFSPSACLSRTYQNPAGTNRNIIDLAALPLP